ncbi:Ig-like domain-containing protein [Agrococcus sp. SL85]|uniref:Ig-like domain-containing protein n=1 Tax=Agrococcus sp. SL85 TaxID=2995141 RepID=UPI00226D266C|nr:Ig-like domain-containing protein [Agrococcus sp. SL85]WAC67305.1 Ig-like domain-containing protein [Agrococcus sp. SL85]
MLRKLGRHRRSAAAAALISAVSIVLGVLAVAYDGFTATDVDLHDGGVWVTRTQTQQLGHLNVQAEALDAGLVAPTDDFDVLQDGDDVLLLARDSGAAILVDPVHVELGASVQLPAGGGIALGGGVLAITDPASGRLWAMPFDDIAGFDPATAEPTLELEPGLVAAVSLGGEVHAISPESATQVRVVLDDEGTRVERQERRELSAMAAPSLTVVGDEPVVLDAGRGSLLLPGGAVEAPEGSVLQQVGDASDAVVLATATALVHQPLDGGAPAQEERGGAAEAVAPVQLGGCAYGVWPGSGVLVRDCEDDARDAEHLVDGLDGSEAVFRVNRGTVVLNQVAEGSSWLLSDRLVLVDNWTDLVPPTSDERSDEEDESTEDRFEDQLPPPSEENQPPVANPDSFGARDGRATLLPVLWNDSDPDGDVLTASVAGSLPDGVVVAPVEQDSQLQVQLPEGFTGDFAFEYRIADGRGETATSTVDVDVRGDDENEAPRSLRDATLVVEQGATVEYQVLQDWLDPDGDDLYLMGATSPSGDTVQTDPSGRLVYTATGEAGLQDVELRISDGREEAAGRLSVDVRERGDAAPQANADFVSTIVGREASIRPLLNDSSPSGDPLRLALVQEEPGIEMRWDGATGIVEVLDAPLGTHYLTYVVAGSGTTSATGRIRVDVRDADDEARPVAVRDTALLPQGGQALVDLLQNDVDPAGGVLVVQSIAVQGASPITVELVDRRLLRIRDSRGLEAPLQLTYAVSNGRFTETGTVEVIPVAPPAQPRAPVAVDDTATVRAGDFQSIDVLANDFSPDGAPFTLVREVVSSSFASVEEGVAFVSEGMLRVHALEGAPSRATVAYEVEDEQGNRDTATVTIRIVPRDPEQNAAPSPRPVTARVLAGATVRIPIPLDGIDGDGDGVELVGYDTAPDQGRIEETGPDHFDFEAYPDAGGTVEFTYRVRDRWGASATATATIGIAQAADVNQAPFAETDTVTARPGRAIAIPVLENDSDPDQDPLRLEPDGLDLPPELAGATVDVERGTVDLVTPDAEGVHQLTYVVADARGLTTTGIVMLTVSETAALEPPIARDDPVSAAELVLGQATDVPVLENDLDPDGDPDDLELSIVTGPGTVAGSAVQVIPTESFQVVAYRVTDIDGQTAEAFVGVPPVRDRQPVLSIGEPLQIPSGEERLLPLRDVVAVSSGNAPRITAGETVTAVNDDGSGLVVDTQTLRFRSAPGYVGPASVTFEVTDGTGPEDPDGATAVLTLPIEVVASSVIPPSFAGASLQAVAGEQETRFDLRSATSDPDPGDLEAMRYSGLEGGVRGVEARLEGSSIVLAAERTATPGTSGAYTVRLEDPHGNEVTGTVLVEVVATNRPLAIANADRAEGEQGVPIEVDVLANDVNPFARDGVPLELVSAEVVGGDGSAAVAGRRIAVTSGADFSGTLTVRYVVQDGTGLTERQVSGTATVTVKGRPDAPPRPNVDAVGDAQVTLTWAAPAPNGAPITGYLVRSADGAISQPCAATTCVVQGLTNDVTYRFQVVAQNEVGDSEPSPASADARPDRRPEQPSAPSATRGDGSLAIAWAPAVSNGSPVSGYTLQIQPPAPDGTVAVELAAVTAHTWQGLANGTAYTFRLQAHNAAPEPSELSAPSAPTIPAGLPSAPSGASAAVDRSTPGEVQMTVTWEAASGNGIAVDSYLVRSSTGLSQTVTGTSARFAQVPLDGSQVTFTVAATNAVGTGAASAPTEARTAATAPGAPSAVRVTDGDGQVRVDWTPGSRNGLRADEVRFEVRANGGGVQSFGPGGTYTGLSNTGGPYTIEVRATATIDGQALASGWTVSSNQARPFGPPPAPVISITPGVHQVTYQWAPNGSNGRALDRIEWTQYENGQNMQRVSPAAGSQTQQLSPGHQAYMTAIVVDVDGNVSDRITIGPVAAGYAPPPQPRAAVTGYSGGVTFSFGPNGTTDRPLDRLEWILDDGASGWTVVRPAADGSFSGGREPGNQACIRVRAIDSGGLESEHIVACGYALP